jgi:hypothetical protein
MAGVVDGKRWVGLQGEVIWMRQRTLLNGAKVESHEHVRRLSINTKAPRKWVAVDTETGELWVGSEQGWERADDATIALVGDAARLNGQQVVVTETVRRSELRQRSA